mmetsp:Transcript_77613/g.179994  ORF Transcript_77613/g.179994 Transcript_77613/m.179994 type:complete len:285 (+) Transcript_77613:455-1309(+)
MRGGLEELPSAAVPPVGASSVDATWVRQRPDGAEVLREASEVQEVQDSNRAAFVAREHSQHPSRRQFFEELPQLGHAAAADKGRCKVVGNQVVLAPVFARGLPAHLLSTGLVLRHEGGQRDGLVKVEDDELYRPPQFTSLEVALLTTHLQRLLAHPRILHEAPQGLVVGVIVRANASHVLDQAKVHELRVVACNLAIPDDAEARVALEVVALVIHQHNGLGLQPLQLLEWPVRLICCELREPRRGMRRHVVQQVRLVVVHLLHGRLETLPDARLLVRAASDRSP